MKLQDFKENCFDMSDDDRDIDVDLESEDEEDDNDSDSNRAGQKHNSSQAEKRAHHNALERKRRDHIKDSFTSLREAVPSLQGEKASRAQILKKAAEYIQFMRRKNQSHNQDIDDLKRQNNILETQIRQLERARDSYNGGASEGNDIMLNVNNNNSLLIKSDNGHSNDMDDNSSEQDEEASPTATNGSYSRRNKKLKPNY